MNYEFSSSSLTELEQIITTLLANSKCSCHFINPSKTRILLWKEIKNGQEIYHLRIGLQRFISSAATDRNNEIYWKFEGAEKNLKVEVAPEEEKKELDPISKFQHRQNQAINHAKSSNPEQSH